MGRVLCIESIIYFTHSDVCPLVIRNIEYREMTASGVDQANVHDHRTSVSSEVKANTKRVCK